MPTGRELVHQTAAKAWSQSVEDGLSTWPALKLLADVAEAIRRYDAMLGKRAAKHFGKETELLQTVPGVGIVTAAAFVACVDDPERFGKARDAGCL